MPPETRLPAFSNPTVSMANLSNEPNPYALSKPLSASAEEPTSDVPDELTENDWKDLQRGTQRSKERVARWEPFFWPLLVLIFAVYQFWMCWLVSESSGTSFGELFAHDSAGFPADSYDGGFVQMFDRFVTGFCLLMAAVFMYFISAMMRKRDLQNHRIHQAMVRAGLIPPDEESANDQ